MLSPLLRHLLSEEHGRTEWTGTGDRAWAVRRQRRGGGGGGGGGSGSFERYASAAIDMPDYDRRDINVSVEDGKVIVHGCRREGDDSSFEAHETRRSLELPADADASQLRYAKARGVVNLEVPLVKSPRSGGRRHRPDERRLTVEQPRRAIDDNTGAPAPEGGASSAADAAGAAMGPWRRRDEAAAAYLLRVPAPGFSASNVEVILVEGKVIVKALIKDSDGMRSMRHSFVVPASLDAGRMKATFVAASTGDGGELLLTAPEVHSPVSGDGGGEGLVEGKLGEFAAATQQLSPEFVLAGGGASGRAPDVTAADADRSAQHPLVEAESLEGISFPQPPAEGIETPTVDAASAPPEAAASTEAENAAVQPISAGGEAKEGAWPLTKSPFELGLEPPPYAAAADASAGGEAEGGAWPPTKSPLEFGLEQSQFAAAAEKSTGGAGAGDERWWPFSPSGDAAASTATTSKESEVVQQQQQQAPPPPSPPPSPLHEVIASRYESEYGVTPAPPTGTDEPPTGVELEAPEAQTATAVGEPVSGAAAGGVVGAGEAWPPMKSPIEKQQLHSVALSKSAEVAEPGVNLLPLPSGEAAASEAAPREAAAIEESEQQQQQQQQQPPLQEPFEPQYGYGYGYSYVSSPSQPLTTDYFTISTTSTTGEVDGGLTAQQSSVGESERGEVGPEAQGIGLEEELKRLPEAQEEVERRPEMQEEVERRPEAQEEVERRPETQEDVERRTEAAAVTGVGGPADVEAKHAPVVADVPPEQLYIIGGEEQQDAARSEAHGDHMEKVERRPEAEEVSAGGTADTRAADIGAVYVPGAYTIRSGQRGYASLAMPTPEKAAAAVAERRYGHEIGSDGGRAHHRTTPDDVAEGAPTFPPSTAEKARSAAGEEPVPRDAGHAKTLDVASTQQEMRRAHELGGA